MTSDAVHKKEDCTALGVGGVGTSSEKGSCSCSLNRFLLRKAEFRGDTRSLASLLELSSLGSFLPGAGVNDDLRTIFFTSSKAE